MSAMHFECVESLAFVLVVLGQDYHSKWRMTRALLFKATMSHCFMKVDPFGQDCGSTASIGVP